MLGHTKSNLQPLGISKLIVRNLFGVYSYDIHLDTTKSTIDPRLLILYGDNGTGKTTLLHLAYHLLSSADESGHRSELARSIFQHFEIVLWNDWKLSATRSENEITGPYTISLARPDTPTLETYLPITSSGGVNSKELPDDADSILSAIYQEIRNLKLRVFLLTDMRQLQSDVFSDHNEPEGNYYWHRRLNVEDISDTDRLAIAARDYILETSMRRVTNWARKSAISATSESEESHYTIYTQIIRRLKSTSEPTIDGGEDTLEDVVNEFIKVRDRATVYTELGLFSIGSLGEMIRELSNTPPQHYDIIKRITKPFAESMGKKRG